MPVVLTSPDKLSKAADQKKALLESVGDLSKIELLQDHVLLGAYIESNVLSTIKTNDGRTVQLYGTANRTAESVFQGKVGLILKMGPTAFAFDPDHPAFGTSVHPKVGDWVVHRTSDAWDLQLNGRDGPVCRIIRQDAIKAVVTDPAYVF